MLTMAAPVLELSDDERTSLGTMARSTSLPHRVVVQAKGLLLAADGVANNEIARRCNVTPNAVRRWRSKSAEGIAGVGRIRPGRGRKPELAPELIAAIVHDTLHTTPEDATHWSTRSMAEHAGVGKDTVARIWRARNIRPWRVETFKLSNDPNFETQARRRRRALSRPAGAGGGPVLRREVPMPGLGAQPALAAAHRRPGRHHDP